MTTLIASILTYPFSLALALSIAILAAVIWVLRFLNYVSKAYGNDVATALVTTAFKLVATCAFLAALVLSPFTILLF